VLMLMVERDRVLENVVLAKLKRNVRNVMATVATSATHLYIITPDEALSIAFLYSVYLYAKQRGLEAKMYYVTSVDPDKLPEEVKRIGEVWIRRRLSNEEIAKLRNKFITGNLLEAFYSI
jgi:hypothetical protein